MLTLAIVLSAGACSSNQDTSGTTLGRITDYRSDKVQPLAQNLPAPDFQFQATDGKQMLLSELQGKVVLLNFWGVNCPYCVAEMPFLQKAHEQLSASGLVVLAINTGDPEKSVQKFMSARNLTFQVILDPDVYASLLYEVRYIPATYIIDKTGKINTVRIGAFPDTEEIVNAVQAVLDR